MFAKRKHLSYDNLGILAVVRSLIHFCFISLELVYRRKLQKLAALSQNFGDYLVPKKFRFSVLDDANSVHLLQQPANFFKRREFQV